MIAWNNPIQTMVITTACQHCGAPVPALHHRKRNCKACEAKQRKAYNAKRRRKRADQAKSAVRQPIEVRCVRCGQAFLSRNRRRSICDACGRRRRTEYQRAYQQDKKQHPERRRKTPDEVVAARFPTAAVSYVPTSPAEPTLAPPGSAAKVAALAARARAGMELFDDRDADGWEAAPSVDYRAALRAKFRAIQAGTFGPAKIGP